MWWIAASLGGSMLKGELAGFDDLDAPEQTVNQELAWDLLRGHAPRHTDATTLDRQGRWLLTYALYGLFQWDHLPPTAMEGAAGALAGSTTRIRLDLPDGAHALTLPVQPTAFGVHAVDGVLGDGATVRFWVDTGAPLTTLTRSTARRAGVPDDARFARLPTLDVGGLHVEQVEVLILEDGALNLADGMELDAILGWNVLWRLAATFDGRARTLTLAPPSGDPDEDRLVWWGYPMVRATIGGEPVVLAVDTGSTGSYLTDRAAKRLGLATVKGSRDRFSGVDGDLVARRALAEPVDAQIGDLAVPFDGDLYGGAWDWGPVPVDGCIGIDLVDTVGALHLDFGSTRLELRPYAGP